VGFVVSLQTNVDVPLACVALEQVEHEQAWPFGHRPLLLIPSQQPDDDEWLCLLSGEARGESVRGSGRTA
jgi:hypothetical protein